MPQVLLLMEEGCSLEELRSPPELQHGHWMGTCGPTILNLDGGFQVPTHAASGTYTWPPSSMASSQDLANDRS
jgi:hypothetical protein